MDLPLEIVAAVGEAQCLGEDILIVCSDSITSRNLFTDIVSSYGFREVSAVEILLSITLKIHFDKGSLKVCSAKEDPMHYRGGVYKIRFADQWDSFIDQQRKEEWMRIKHLYSREL